ncbi:MAG: cytochrome c maturation protein CcmE [Deltaproteobacteria bacterium]|nr:MAG: cytochrome c maturation protein CcmE [Deltaproteobacteria bacterium]
MSNQGPLLALGALLVGAGALAWVAMSSLEDNKVYYYSPTEVMEKQAVGTTVRLGGMVEAGSHHFDPAGPTLDFRVTDGQKSLAVHGTVAPPQMFREGIGVVIEGHLDDKGTFQAEQVLVKHDNEYKAPEDGQMPDIEATLADR